MAYYNMACFGTVKSHAMLYECYDTGFCKTQESALICCKVRDEWSKEGTRT